MSKMTLFLCGHNFRYETENILRMFYREIEVQNRAATKAERRELPQYMTAYRSGEKGTQLTASVHDYHATLVKTAALPETASGKEAERALAAMMFDILVAITGRRPEWGIMTGVRPAKFVKSLMADGLSDTEIEEKLRYDYRVTRGKARLAIETARVSEDFSRGMSPRSYSLYISIPFCPTRCEYCSFVSKTVERDGEMLQPYLDCLVKELAATAKKAEENRLKLETVYIGGGTPTVLSAEQLRGLLSAAAEYFPMNHLSEYTVEAGRPDTITLDKLRVLRDYGVTRISVNPQTFDDRVLRQIGRMHTAGETLRAFGEAKRAGFSNINADLIAGLRGDTLKGFQETLRTLLALEPQGITVHALTLKRASGMRDKEPYFSEDAAAMVEYAQRELAANGYRPYYMYKQKGTVDGLENTGYAKPGFEGRYNVYIMDELHSILSAGAGGVTKLCKPFGGRIERIFNYKYPREYISGFQEILVRKEGIGRFYESVV